MTEDEYEAYEKGLERVTANISMQWHSHCPKCGGIEAVDHENTVNSLSDLEEWTTVVHCCGQDYLAVIKKPTV